MDDDYVSVEEVAAQLSVHPDTVRRWLRAGKLPGMLISRKAGYRIRREDVAAFMRSDSGIQRELLELSQIPRRLRDLADRIERGEVDNVQMSGTALATGMSEDWDRLNFETEVHLTFTSSTPTGRKVQP